MQRFLNLLDNAPPEKEERLQALAVALDELASAIHKLPEGEVAQGREKEPETPRSDYKQLAELTARSFSELGFYPWADPVSSIDEPVMMGDAIDDLADIAKDLSEAIWV